MISPIAYIPLFAGLLFCAVLGVKYERDGWRIAFAVVAGFIIASAVYTLIAE